MLRKTIYFLVFILLILTAFPLSSSKNIENNEKTQNVQPFLINDLIHAFSIYFGNVVGVSEITIDDVVYYSFFAVNIEKITFYYPLVYGVFTAHITEEDIIIDKSRFHGIIIEGFICGWEYRISNAPP
jgi:hypothetical protein